MFNDIAESARRPVAIWLFLIAVLIFAMVILGGLTRLTDSGLSMVDWRPLMGAVPPLTETEWLAVFSDYQQYPEYLEHNQGMELGEFKFIFYMEYCHRLLGRLIGMVFFFPFAYFLFKRVLNGRAIRRLTVLFIMGGMQGVVGWYMVKSGLVDIPRVSQYRLVLHLSMAILVFSLSLWYVFDLTTRPQPEDRAVLASLRGKMAALFVLLGLQITTGGFVAGLKAGLAFNTWPTMNGQFIPAGLWSSPGLLANFFENPVMVQFIHRNLALIVTACLLFFYGRYRTMLISPRTRLAWNLMVVCLVAQVTLGISTLVMAVPVSLASAHQAVALLLWAVVLFMLQQMHVADKLQD